MIFNACSWGIKPTLEAQSLPPREEQKRCRVAQAGIPRERATLKFRDECAGAVMAKALEGGSDSEKEEPLFPEGKGVPAPLETLLNQ